MADYYTLVTGLPWLPEQMEKCTQLPLSRIALERRLTLLNETDQKVLRSAEALYHPSLSNMQPDQARVQAWQQQVDQLPSETLRQVVGLRLEIQTLLAALRYRRRPDTQAEHFQGFGRWTQWIRQHWKEPLFGLEGRLEFLEHWGELFAQGQTGDLQTQVDLYLWRQLLAVERSHHFTLETVVCFVLRWGLAERRLRSDPDAALNEFQALGDALLQHSGIQQRLTQLFEDSYR
ncbi:V-type ATP synthase subunit C [Nitrincola lacisaponensis]|uniref:V-type ATP synthase subunit C n=1 Tax=Nitrincola lacisaponensis TaxID=267850 RepID=A0A063Y583_9GAMM|nr:DUF2764 family protein [Nitrincola lacisaponensis]KDE40315.1 V-type ATP synthase subunit C [Nitrincola lacisaponensis]